MIVVWGRNLCCIDCVDQWCKHVNTLSAVAASQLHFPLFQSLCCLFEWTFIMRVICNCGPLFSELENCLSSIFIPALFGIEVSLAERQLFSLPLREGGLGIFNLTDNCFLSSS